MEFGTLFGLDFMSCCCYLKLMERVQQEQENAKLKEEWSCTQVKNTVNDTRAHLAQSTQASSNPKGQCRQEGQQEGHQARARCQEMRPWLESNKQRLQEEVCLINSNTQYIQQTTPIHNTRRPAGSRSSTQHSATPRNITQHHATSRNITQHHATSRNITQRHATPRNTTQHHAAPRSTTQHPTPSQSIHYCPSTLPCTSKSTHIQHT